MIITLLSLVSLTTFIIPASLEPGSLKIDHLNVLLGRSNYERHAKAREFAFVKYDIVAGEHSSAAAEAELPLTAELTIGARRPADMTPLFNWNTKQVFVYLTADYSTSKYVRASPGSDHRARC